MELLDESHADGYEYRTHNESAQDAPEKDLMLVDRWYMEVGKNHQKHEQVVNAERLFYHIPCQELKSFLLTELEIYPDIEHDRYRYPEKAQ